MGSGAPWRRTFAVLWVLALRDIKVRYKAPWLGVVWAFVVPLVLSLVLVLVFGRVLSVAGSSMTFLLFIVTGMFPWNFFQQSVVGTTTCLQQNADVIRKIDLPRMALPLAETASHGFNFLCAMIVLVLLVVYLRGISPWWFLLLPALGCLGLFTAGLALLVAALQVSYRDVKYLVEVGLWLWFYLTPIFYPLTAFFQQPSGLIGWYLLNPMVSVVTLIRIALLGPQDAGLIGGLTITHCLIYASVAAAVSWIIGSAVFQCGEAYFADLVS